MFSKFKDSDYQDRGSRLRNTKYEGGKKINFLKDLIE